MEREHLKLEEDAFVKFKKIITLNHLGETYEFIEDNRRYSGDGFCTYHSSIFKRKLDNKYFLMSWEEWDDSDFDKTDGDLIEVFYKTITNTIYY